MPANVRASYSWKLSPSRIAKLSYSGGAAHLAINDKELCRTSNTLRLVTDESGKLKQATGIAAAPENVALRLSSGREQKITLAANQTVTLSAM